MVKKQIICLLWGLLFFLITLNASQAKIISYDTVIDLNFDSSRVRIAILVNFEYVEPSLIRFPISFYPQNIIVYSAEGIIPHKIESFEDYYVVILDKQFKQNTPEIIYIEFENKDSVHQIQKNYLFGFQQTVPPSVEEFALSVKLPEGAVISNITGISPVSPEPASIQSDGRRIILEWKETDISESMDFRIIVAFEQSTPQVSPTDYIWVVLLFFALVFPVLIYFLFKKRELKLIAIGLDKDEKKIYDFILLKKEIKQKTIQKELDFSKARLSKLLRKLEEKKLIEKKPVGRINLIKIKK